MPRDGATGTPESLQQVRASARSWALLLFVVALWEIFLRIDSRILRPSTKLWLFPLLLVTFTTLGATWGALLGAVARWGGDRFASRVHRIVLPLGVAAAAALEYALLADHHDQHRVNPWLTAAIAAAAIALTVALQRRSRRRAARGPGEREPTVDDRADTIRRLWGVAILTLPAVAGIVLALVEPEIAGGLIRRQSAFGRVLGHSLTRFPPRLAPAASIVVIHPRDLPASQPSPGASVVLLSIDTLRRDALGVYGRAPSVTPALDALAARSVVFTDAFTQSPNSAPSIAGVLTGLLPHGHGVRRNRMVLDSAHTTLAETLAAAGYATAAFVTNPNFPDPFNFRQGFATFRYLPSALDADGLMTDSTDVDAVEQALAWAGAHRGEPVFLWVHLMAPHAPYLPPGDLRPAGDHWRGPWFDVWNMRHNEATLEHGETSFDAGRYAALYEAEVAAADRVAGRLVRGLEELRLLDGAHLVVLADHGEAFGEGDVFAHGHGIEPAQTRVPLLWRLPGAARAGAAVNTTVQLADVAPTLLRLLGVAPPGRADGRDLSAMLVGEQPDDDGFAFSEARYLGTMGVRGLLYAGRTRTRTLWIDAGYPYACEFDRAADPDERRRVAYARQHRDALYGTVVNLAVVSQRALASSYATIRPGAEEAARLRALGYVE